MNQYGLMTKIFDIYTKKFIKYTLSLESEIHVAELGAAYGAVTQEIIRHNKKVKITVNDLDKRHLTVLQKKIKNQNNSIQIKPKIVIGRLPDGINFAENTFDAILAARVMQYLLPRDLIKALKKIRLWLKPKGKLFLVTKTPYIKMLSTFITTYERRKSRGDRWPGVIKDFNQRFNHDISISHIVPKFIHVFDPDILKRACIECGLIIEECSFINRKDLPLDIRLTGKEEVGLIAHKE
ncbi:MAG: hypothetical protein A2X47_11580 [Lentisphaerae bacterium GWF2_38_69]|nr:MAG: hypothetical protein A2X47_11580 [Lentisphaerae bacterium GWF2_38_69]